MGKRKDIVIGGEEEEAQRQETKRKREQKKKQKQAEKAKSQESGVSSQEVEVKEPAEKKEVRVKKEEVREKEKEEVGEEKKSEEKEEPVKVNKEVSQEAVGEELVEGEEEKKELKKEIKKAKPKAKKVRSQKYQKALGLIDNAKKYKLEEAIALVKKSSYVKFDASLEAHIRLGIDYSKSEQHIRGAVNLPNGTGRKIKVAAVVGVEHDKEAKAAGADITGSQDLVSKIEKGFLDFDVLVATPDQMQVLGKASRILGPKGLMPNQKTGTVTDNPAKIIKELKAGRVEYKTDSEGNVHVAIGKVSFDDKKLAENFNTLLEEVKAAKPEEVKQNYIKSVTLAATMGPGVRVRV